MKVLIIIALLLNLFIFIESSNPTIIEITLDNAGTTEYTTQCGQYTQFKVNFPYPCKDLNITTYPTQGETDIFVSLTNEYPKKTDLSWAATATGEYTVSISHWEPESSTGYYYISVYGDCSLQPYPAKYTIAASSYDNTDQDSNDLVQYPSVGINQITGANDYRYFRFCVPQCSDIKVTLQNCLSDAECPGAYSYPELLVTRNIVEPTVYDYTFKLAQIVRRYIRINITDPSARDSNGRNTGTYYVGVYGWCTPDEYVNNNSTDGPCSYISNVLFNVTVTLFQQPAAKCNAPLTLPPEPNYPQLTSGLTYPGYVACNKIQYYSIPVPSPCYDLNIFVTTTSDAEVSAAELAVGKYPVVRPTFANLEWTSYDWAVQNLTISAWDPNFDGGYICGPNGDSLCYIYIGVVGYCGINDSSPFEYDITATLTRSRRIYGKPQINQKISAHGTNFYEFCVDHEADITAQLLAWNSACDCPNTYSDLNMVISKTSFDANANNLVWHIDTSDVGYKQIQLLDTDSDTRPGTYYVNVIGDCSDTCTDSCTCAPCANLENSEYALLVNETSATVSNSQVLLEENYNSNRATYLGSSCGESSTVCSSTCTITESTSSSSSTKSISTTAIVLLAVLLGGGGIIILAVILYFFFSADRKGKYDRRPSNASDDSQTNMKVIELEMPTTTL